MTNEPIKKDYGKNDNNYDEAKNNGIISRAKRAAWKCAKRNLTPKKILKAVFPKNLRTQIPATALEVLVAGLALQNIKFFNDPLQHAKGAAYFARHAGNTIKDAALGGPEGMRAAMKLEEAIQILKENSATDPRAAEAYNAYKGSKEEFVRKLVDVYQENETWERTCNRLGVQLRGMVKNTLEIGNDIKILPVNTTVDDTVALLFIKANMYAKRPGYEQYEGLTNAEIIALARKNSKVVSDLYDEIQKFYSGRELNEKTVNEFCSYLGKNEKTAAEQNKKLEKYFPEIIGMVKNGYKIEDILFRLESKGINITEEEVKGAGKTVKVYKENGEQVRAEIKADGVPMQKDPGYNLVDIALNPFVVAAAAVMVYKGLSKTIMPVLGFIDDQIAKAVCLPMTGAWYGTKWGARKGIQGVKTLYKKGKEYISGGQNEDPKGTSN